QAGERPTNGARYLRGAPRRGGGGMAAGVSPFLALSRQAAARSGGPLWGQSGHGATAAGVLGGQRPRCINRDLPAEEAWDPQRAVGLRSACLSHSFRAPLLVLAVPRL